LALKKLINVSTIALVALGGVACGGGGSSTGTTTPPVQSAPPQDNAAPTVSFNPATLTVIGGASTSAALSATDNVGVTSGPTITCTNGGGFTGRTFSAPAVTTATTSVCTATAGDVAGNSGTGELTVSITPDTTGPSLTFSPAALTLVSASTGTSTVSVTDNSGVAITPTFSCTNGGSFSGNTFTAPAVTANTTVVCTATANDASGNSSTADLTVEVTPPPAAVTISGSITFDHVPFNTSNSALDYDNITQDPAPGLTLEALSSTGAVLQSTVTDANGNYSVEVNPNTDVRIRVKAEMLQTSGAQWNVRVVDNTSSGALYSLQGSLATSGTVNSTRNLNAASGWGGSSYTSTRAAGPFAILAPIYESLQRIVAVDPDVVFPFIDFNWSVNNRPGMNDNLSFDQNIANGDIGTSSYVTSSNGDRRVLILGAANTDTDEYDEHVVIHEWGHYFEDQLSRSDSIGGPHSLGDRLDPRVALGEGFGNALSGMLTDDPFYRDSFGSGQASGFQINVESNNYFNEGWFNEGSVQSILYDIYDADDDGSDTISAGLEPIYNVLTSPSYTGTDFFTTIFTFLDEYRANNPADVSAVNALTTTQSISGTNVEATDETNTGSVSNALPLYQSIPVNGTDTEVCVTTTAGTTNKLGNRVYLTFDVTSPGLHTLRATRTSGSSSTDPDFFVFRSGTLLAIGQSGAPNTETDPINLTTAGQHIIDLFDFNDGQACFDFRITR